MNPFTIGVMKDAYARIALAPTTDALVKLVETTAKEVGLAVPDRSWDEEANRYRDRNTGLEVCWARFLDKAVERWDKLIEAEDLRRQFASIPVPMTPATPDLSYQNPADCLL